MLCINLFGVDILILGRYRQALQSVWEQISRVDPVHFDPESSIIFDAFVKIAFARS